MYMYVVHESASSPMYMYMYIYIVCTTVVDVSICELV